MLARVAIRGRVAAERRAAGLARAQVDPAGPRFHARLALPLLGLEHLLDSGDVGAGAFRHGAGLSRLARSQFASVAPASYVVRKNARTSASGVADVRTASCGRTKMDISWL